MRVDGLEAAKARLLELRDAALTAKVLSQAARKAFKPVIEAARQKVPVDTGLLRDSIRVTAKQPKRGDTSIVVGLRIAAGGGGGKRESAAWRWHFVELGTAKLPARPFLRPALDRNHQAVLELFKVELQKSIAKALKKRAA